MESQNRCKPDYEHNNAYLKTLAYISRRPNQIKLGNDEKGNCKRK